MSVIYEISNLRASVSFTVTNLLSASTSPGADKQFKGAFEKSSRISSSIFESAPSS